MYSASIGSISPSMRSSTTVEFPAVAGGADCARSDAEEASDSAAIRDRHSQKRPTARGNILRAIIATEKVCAVKFRWGFGRDCRLRFRLETGGGRRARQASRQAKRRQAAALPDWLLSSFR